MGRVITTTAGLFPPNARDRGTDLVELQRRVGLDRVVSAYPEWARGVAEPLARQPAVSRVPAIAATHGSEPPYVRTGPFRPTGLLRTRQPVPTARSQIVLPGPYTLARLVDDRYAHDEIDTLVDIASWLRGETDRAPPHRTAMILEPALVHRPPTDDIAARLAALLDRVVAPLSDPILYPWGGALTEKVHAHALDADLHAMGYDAIADADGVVDLIAEFGTTDALAFGIVDAETGVGIRAEVIAERAETLRSRAFAEGTSPTYLLPNRPLAALPMGTVEPMLAELGSVERRVAPT